MRKNILSTLVLLGAAGTLTACNFEQPEAGCIVQDASFALWFGKYELVEGPTPTTAGATCTAANQAPAGENLGVWKFYNPETDTATLTIRPVGLANLGARDPNNAYSDLHSTGSLSTDVDGDDFCTTGNDWTVGRVNAAATATAAATSVSYQYNNVKVYSAPFAPGTQLTGELTYVKDGCTSKYVVRALWPSTPCDPTLDPADPENAVDTCGAGSGLNPDFDVSCDSVTEHCILSKPVPSFKNQ